MDEVLPTTRRVEFIDKKDFAKAVLDEDIKTFVIHISSFNLKPMTIDPVRKAQTASLLTEKVTVLVEYLNFAEVFSEKWATKLSKHFDLNKHLINLKLNKQPPYGPIYSLGLVELKTLKTYIETNLINSFIRPSKSPAGALILFV